MSFNRTVTHTARKEHRCDQCGGKIGIGSRYNYHAQMWEGEFSPYREHSECGTAWSEFAFEVNGYDRWEGAPFICEMEIDEPEDAKAWMIEHHPIVAERLGWAPRL